MYACVYVNSRVQKRAPVREGGEGERQSGSAVKGALASAERDMPPAPAHACTPFVPVYVCVNARVCVHVCA